jgi:DNA polymerase III subunit epsilon
MRQIILDTETTGLSPREGHKIIEIGCVEAIKKIRTGNVFHAYINPQREVSAGAFKVHGLSTNFLQDKPLFKDIAKDFLDFIKDSELIIHNARFDMGFINHELESINFKAISKNSVIDTLMLARKKFPGSPANLNALCKRFNINLEERDKKGHGALLDSELLYRVYICLTEGIQSELLTKKETKVTVSAGKKERMPPRKFSYAEDFARQKQFLGDKIPKSLWEKQD